MKVIKRVLTVVMSVMALFAFAAAADIPLENTPSEVSLTASSHSRTETSIDDTQESEMAWDSRPTWNDLWMSTDESDEDETTISPREARSPPLSVYNVVSIQGTRVNSDGTVTYDVTENFNVKMQDMFDYYPETTKNTYSTKHPLTVVLYKYGNGSGLGFKSGTGYTINTGRPYAFVKNSYGDAVGYKFNETITITDKSLTKVTLPTTAKSRISPYNTYTRDLTILLATPE